MYKTLKEASGYLGKSEKTISRYIKRGILHPDRVKGQTGTLTYQFLEAELETLQERLSQTGQRTDTKTQEQTSEKVFLYSQIAQKDRQIEHLNRQVNVYSFQVSSLTNRLLELPAPKETPGEASKQAKRLDKSLVFWLTLLVIAVVIFVYFNIYPVITETLKGVMIK